MNILVLGTAASDGGALTVLKNLYSDVLKDTEGHHWYFTVSNETLKSKENITVVPFEWTKKSWIHRLYFDKVSASKLVKEYDIDVVISLQNTITRSTNVKHILYLQQSLPFVDKRYTLREDKKLWIYQNVISKFISKAVKKSNYVIVQSQWMKDALIEKYNESVDKIIVSKPNLDVSKLIKNNGGYTNQFFYPADSYRYKNHEMILESLMNIDPKLYKMTFTITCDQDDYRKSLCDKIKNNNLNVDCTGIISYEDVCKYYSESILIFASEIETFGLPLLEARLSNSIVLALETPFSKEILEGYSNAYYFNNKSELKTLIDKVIHKEIINLEVKQEIIYQNEGLYETINQLIK